MERLVVLDSSPERPRRQPSNVGDLLTILRGLDLSSLISRRDADQLLRDKIPVSPPVSTHIHTCTFSI